MSEDVKLTAYFERIGFAGSIAPTLATLEALHALQPAAIAFENLDSLLNVPVPLDQASLNRKLLAERRGGYCFEQNLLFLSVLRELGFEARAHAARVLWGRAQAERADATHMVMTVDIGGASYLADVGFGGLTLTAPLKLRDGLVQETAHERFRIVGEDPELTLEVERRADDWRPVYQFGLGEVETTAFAALNLRLNADPDWFFHQHLLAELSPPAGRRMLFDTRLTTGTGEDREVRQLQTIGDIREVLADVFGLGLGDLDGLDAALGRLLSRATPAS